MSDIFQQILKSKDAERRRLRELPWPEKMEMLDKLRARQVLLAKMQPRSAQKQRD